MGANDFLVKEGNGELPLRELTIGPEEAPKYDEGKENEERKPRDEDLPWPGRGKPLSRRGFALLGKPPDPLGPPAGEKERERHQRYDARHDIDQADIEVVAPSKLRDREGNSADKDRGQHFQRFSPGHHGLDEPERNDDRRYGEDPSVHGA